jgi:hypothetical protein
LRAFSFIHAADLHLGYSQYGLEARREDLEKALIVHPIVLLRESEVSEEIVRSIFESRFADLKTKAFEYFLHIFGERCSREEAEKAEHVIRLEKEASASKVSVEK